MINEVLTVSNIRSCDIDLAKPGENVRIIPVKDVIEPRVKVEGPRNLFPGLIGDPTTIGFGRTHAFKGIAEVTVLYYKRRSCR